MTGLWLSLWLAVASATGPIELVVGGVTISAEVADDAAERRVGLMGRQSLPKNHGMLFVYPDQAVRSFWMKNTLIPLDMLFLDTDGKIIAIARNTVPGSLRSIGPGVPVKAVLELNGGRSEALGIEPGDVVELGAGTWQLTDGLSLDVANVTVRGAGTGEGGSILDFTGQQGAGEGFDVAPGDGAEEDKLQHLVIGQGGGAAGEEPVAQAFAVVAEVGGLFRLPLAGGRGAVVAVEEREGQVGEGTRVAHAPHDAGVWLAKG